MPDSRRVILRIGINLGDIIMEGSDLHGDGVNVAARLEALGEPGDICVSGSVYDQVERKVEVAFGDLGQKSLKNIAEPMRVYRVGHLAIADRKGKTGPLPLPALPSIAVLEGQRLRLACHSVQQGVIAVVDQDLAPTLHRFIDEDDAALAAERGIGPPGWLIPFGSAGGYGKRSI